MEDEDADLEDPAPLTEAEGHNGKPTPLGAYLTNLSNPGDPAAEAAGPSRTLDPQIPLEDENADIEELLCYWERQALPGVGRAPPPDTSVGLDMGEDPSFYIV